MRVVLTGGGTGGHLTPLIAVAKALQELPERQALPILDDGDPPLELLYLGIVTDADRRALESCGIPYRHIPSGKVRRYVSGAPRTLFDLLCLVPLGMLKALWTMFFVMPDVVFSKGGYGSVPVVFASWVYRIPTLLHETDLVPGLSNRRIARYVSAVAVSFRGAETGFPDLQKVFVAGTPLRPAFDALPRQEEARKRFKLHDRKPVIFVTGGSQGAQRMNTVVLVVIPKLIQEAQILHQVGEKNFSAVSNFLSKDLRHVPSIEDYHVVGSLTEADMAASFAAADLVISRAGGTALAEISAAGKPSILVPLQEAAQDHQWENAYFFREQGAAVVLDEANLTPAVFASTVQRVLGNPQDLRVMSERVKALHHPGAASEIADVLVKMAQGRVPRRSAKPAA